MPIAQPPGSETFALPNFASKGPRTNIPALIVFTKLYEANFLFCLELLIINLFLLNFVFDPEIIISPLSLLAPKTSNFCMIIL